jgi:hypothetical protein
MVSIEIKFAAIKPGKYGSPIIVNSRTPKHSCAIRAWTEDGLGKKEYAVMDDEEHMLDMIRRAIDKEVIGYECKP